MTVTQSQKSRVNLLVNNLKRYEKLAERFLEIKNPSYQEKLTCKKWHEMRDATKRKLREYLEANNLEVSY